MRSFYPDTVEKKKIFSPKVLPTVPKYGTLETPPTPTYSQRESNINGLSWPTNLSLIMSKQHCCAVNRLEH